MRVEPCACGGSIRAGDWQNSRPFVEAHNRTLIHVYWRWRMGIATPTLDGAPSDDPRRRWPTADDDLADLSLDTGGASAGDVAGPH